MRVDRVLVLVLIWLRRQAALRILRMRFPYMFQLTKTEKDEVVANSTTSKSSNSPGRVPMLSLSTALSWQQTF
jgi:hypothetical protein